MITGPNERELGFTTGAAGSFPACTNGHLCYNRNCPGTYEMADDGGTSPARLPSKLTGNQSSCDVGFFYSRVAFSPRQSEYRAARKEEGMDGHYLTIRPP